MIFLWVSPKKCAGNHFPVVLYWKSQLNDNQKKKIRKELPMIRIGILDLQGDVSEHLEMTKKAIKNLKIEAEAKKVKKKG